MKKTDQKTSELMKTIGVANPMALPRLRKVVVSMGIGKVRDQAKVVEGLTKDLTAITGQKPVVTRARKAISGFKLQKGQPSGLVVTLRAKRMDDFLSRLVNAVLPAIREFKGIPITSVDKSGNVNIGLPEHTLFPEIGFDNPTAGHGLQITVVPNAASREQAIALYKAIGMPLKEKGE